MEQGVSMDGVGYQCTRCSFIHIPKPGADLNPPTGFVGLVSVASESGKRARVANRAVRLKVLGRCAQCQTKHEYDHQQKGSVQ